MLSMSRDVEQYRLLMADVYELAGTSRRSSDALAAEHGQTAARWHVMSVLSDEPASVSAAARRLGLTRQSVQRTVGDLVRAGQIELTPDPADRRAPLASLTPAGRRTLDLLIESSRADREAVLARAGLSASELSRARRVVRALAAALAANPAQMADGQQ